MEHHGDDLVSTPIMVISGQDAVGLLLGVNIYLIVSYKVAYYNLSWCTACESTDEVVVCLAY